MTNFAGFTVIGEDGETTFAGGAVASIGDVNGDGIGDFAVSAPLAGVGFYGRFGNYYERDAGAVYVVFGDEDTDGDGPDEGLPVSINLAELDGSDGFRIDIDTDIADTYYYYDAGFGIDIEGVGDVNGDGVQDFAIAQSRTNYSSYYGFTELGPQNADGVVYVILGDQTFDAVQEVDDLAGFRIDTDGEVQDIVALGDINGDGLADVGVNTVDRNTNGYQYINFTYLYDANGNGQFDIDSNDRFEVGNIRAAVGESTSYVVFGTDEARVSDNPIAQRNFGFPVASAVDGPGVGLLTVPEDAPTAGETIVNATQLDGGDGFSVVTGRTLEQAGYQFNDGFYVNIGQGGGGQIEAVGDINGDGINDFIASNNDYFNDAVNNGTQINIVFNGQTNQFSSNVGYYTSNASFGDFVVLGNAVNDPFDSEINLNSFFFDPEPDIDFQAFIGGAFSELGGIGDVSGNDDIDEFAVADFLTTTISVRDPVTGVFTQEPNPDNPFGVTASGVAVVNGTNGEFLSDDPDSTDPTRRDYELGNIINGQGAFYTDTTSAFRDFSDGSIFRLGFDVQSDSSKAISGVGDINKDGIDDFAVAARFTGPNAEGTSNASKQVVYLIFGQADPVTGLIDLGSTFGEGTAADSRLAFRVEGLEDAFAFNNNFFSDSFPLPVTVDGGFDVNGDDVDDVIIGSPGDNANQGAAHVVFGGLEALAAADAADGTEDGVIDVANLGVDVDTGELPIELSIEGAGLVSEFRSEGTGANTTFSFTVSRTGDLTEAVSFDFAVTGTGFNAADAADFAGGALPSGTVNFANGASTAIVDIVVEGDFDVETTEDFLVTISNPVSAVSNISISGTSTTGRIFNDDLPVRFFAGNATVTEGDPGDDNALIFTVFRNGNTAVEASIDFTIDGSGFASADAADFEAGVFPASGSLSFGAGDTSKQIILPIAEDFAIEPNESVRLTIDNASATVPAAAPPGTVIPVEISDNTGFGTIVTDDFAVQFRVSNAFVTEGNSDADNREMTFVVTRSGNTAPEASVDIAITPGSFNPADASDFEPGEFPVNSLTLDFDAFETQKTVSLAIAEDVDIEADERVEARLSNAKAQNVPASDVIITDNFGSGIIDNDDFPPRIFVSGGGSVFEGNSGFTPVNFVINRTGDTTGITDVTYDLNPLPSPGNFFAADSNDIDGFLPSFGNVVRFEDGESTKTVTVNINGDGIIEPREQFELRITDVESDNGVDYDIFNPSRIATIINDDGRPPVIPPGVEADVFGDPHIVTLDGLGYDFQAVGEYVLVETLPGADNPFEVHVRFEPLEGSDLVSTTTRMAAEFGGNVVEIDALGADPLLINGVAPSANDLLLGALDVDADGTADVFFNADLTEFTIVMNREGEQLQVKRMDGSLNVCVFLADTAGGNQGNVRGLMGDADGNGDTTDDLALREGTVVPLGSNLVDIAGNAIVEDTPLTSDVALPQPLDFDTLYGVFADSWRVDDTNGKDRFFSDTAPAFRTDFPVALLTVEDLPADVRAAAEAAVRAAEDPNDPLDPAVFEAAVLDFALTGNPDFISGALGLAAEQTEETDPEGAPDLPATVSLFVQPTEFTEGDAGTTDVTFTFDRIGDTSVPLTVAYEITGTADADDLAPGTALSGTVDFDVDETRQTVTIQVQGDLDTEDDETLIATITDSGGALVAGASVIATISTDDFAPEAEDDDFSTQADEELAGDLTGDNENGVDDDADGDALTVISAQNSQGGNIRTDGFQTILPSGALLLLNPDGSFTYKAFGFETGISGATDTIFDLLDEGDVETETFTYTISDGNGGEDTATVTINVTGVDDAPVAQLEQFEVSEDDVVSGNVLQGNGAIGQDIDPEGGPLVVTQINGVDLADADEDATTAGTQINLANGGLLTIDDLGNFTFDTDGDFEDLGPQAIPSQLQIINYTIADEGGQTDSTTLRINVQGLNDAPVANDVDLGEVTDEDTAIQSVLSVSDLDDFATDVDSPLGFASFSLLSVEIDGVATDLAGAGISFDPTSGATELNPTGIAAYQDLNDGETATVVLGFNVTDGDFDDQGTVTFQIAGRDDVVIDPNQAPETAEINEEFGEDETGREVELLDPLFVSDPDGDDLEVINLEVLPQDERILDTGFDPETGVLTIADGQFDDLAEGEELEIAITYDVTDGDLSTPNTATVTIIGENDAPDVIAEADVAFDEDDDPILITQGDLVNPGVVEDVDTDLGDLFATALTCCFDVTIDGIATDFEPEIISFAAGPETVWEIAPGQFDFLAEGALLEFSATYLISDGIDAVENTVNVTITGENDAPEAQDGAITLDEDSENLGQLLISDVDTPVEDLVVTITGGPASGAVELGDAGTFTYRPDLNFFGSDSFTYTVSDGDLTSEERTIDITVNPVNDAPEAKDVDLGVVTDEDTAISENIAAFDLADFATDVDDVLDITSFSVASVELDGNPVGAAAAGLSFDANTGVATFDPTAIDAYQDLDDGEFATVEVFFTVTDGEFSDTGTITFQVEGLDEDVVDEPVEVPGTDGSDVLVGDDEDNIITSGGGALDFMTGGGGGDIFVFEGTANANGRELAFVTDYEIGLDQVDLNGRTVTFDFAVGNAVYMFLDGADFDTLVVEGVSSINDIDFV